LALFTGQKTINFALGLARMHGADPMDWDDLRFFLEVIRHRSLVAAAKQLNVTQSTVGRRLASLEAQLGVRLVERTQEGYVPTLAGAGIREHVERVEAEMHSVKRAVGAWTPSLPELSASPVPRS